MEDLKFAEVRAELRCSKTTLLSMLAEGDFPNAYKVRHQWRIPTSDVKAIKEALKAPKKEAV